MIEFVREQIWVSTAEDELNYFTGDPVQNAGKDAGSALPAGTYRIVDGELYRIVPGVPTYDIVVNVPPNVNNA